MIETNEPKNKTVNFIGELTYDWTKDTIHVISKDPKFTLNTFHLSLKHGTLTEVEVRKVLEEAGVIKIKPAPMLEDFIKNDMLTIAQTYELLEALKAPNTNILIASLTGRGKGTFVYSLLNQLATQGENILLYTKKKEFALVEGRGTTTVVLDAEDLIKTVTDTAPSFIFLDELLEPLDAKSIAELKLNSNIIATVHASDSGQALDRFFHVTNITDDTFTHVITVHFGEKTCDIEVRTKNKA